MKCTFGKTGLITLCSLFFFTCINPHVDELLQPKKVTFNSNGGSKVESQVVFKGEKVRKPANPVRNGYDFEGWFQDNASFKTVWNFDVEPAGNITLHAKWIFREIKVITGIKIATQPRRVQYTHGDSLNLSGLVVKVSYNDDSAEDVPLDKFPNLGISTSPADGSVLIYSQANGRPVTVSAGRISGTTANLTVSRAVPAALIWPTAGNIYYGSALYGSALTGGSLTGTWEWVNGMVLPAVGRNWYQVAFTPYDPVNFNWAGVTFTQNIEVTVNPAPIERAVISITAPAVDSPPVTTAPAGGLGYSCGNITWSPNHSVFLEDVAYTAAVTLTRTSANYTFSGGLSDATINDRAADIISNTGTTVVLRYTFPAIIESNVFNISVYTQPSFAYIHGGYLDLSALVVTLTYYRGKT
ncbi:MAG: InlB B-repeat-containing protein, partial [Treponema sp.]|nr:InlB B-repeat-containing protein [Treponema sp.]